jgi:hypothetical protein
MPNILDFDQLTSDARGVTLPQALSEIRRELKTRRSAYERWARNEPTKADTYRKQYRELAALEAVLATFEVTSWNKRINAAYGQGELFS